MQSIQSAVDKNGFVKFGDVVTLYCDQLNGWLTSGDLVVGYGLWVPKLKEKMAAPPRIRETRIQIVPKLYYSSRKAYDKELMNAGDETASTKLEKLCQALAIEDEQNRAEFERLKGEDLLYGQTVQLRHVSGSFVTVKKTMAKFEPACLKVSMQEHGDEGSWFRVEPAFKFRTVGSRIPYGDSLRFASLKFDQSIHVSSSSLPFRNLYINSVHEVNASPAASYFQILAFAPIGDSSNVRGGSAMAIYHSEMNAYLMYDPVNPEKGVFWRYKTRKVSGASQSSNALWILQAETAEFGGDDVLAIKGVESNENPMKKGYRLEHVSSGMYLGMSNSVVEPGVTALTMSDNFVTSQSLWYFRMKSEDRDEDGENSVIQFESDSPLYLQHSNTGWLTHIIPDKKNRLQSNFFGDKRDNIAGLRKDINMKDSMSLLQSDAHSMAQISRLMKLMKPLELFLKSRKMCAPNLKDACTDNLCNIVGMKICGSQACETEAQASPMQKRLKSTQMYVVGRGEILQGDPPNESDKSGDRTSTPIKQNSSPINRGSTPINRDRDSSSRQNESGSHRDFQSLTVQSRKDFPVNLYDHIHYLRSAKRKRELARLNWMLALARVTLIVQHLANESLTNKIADFLEIQSNTKLMQITQSVVPTTHIYLVYYPAADCWMSSSASILSKQFSDITECLQGIKNWLCNNDLEVERAHRWQQKAIRDQGALMQLQDLLDWISNCGVSTIGGWCVGAKGSLKLGSANMRAVRASIMFIKIGNLIYDIFRLACMDYPKNAEVFQRHMSLFDLHLGTELRSALVMRQMFMNPCILASLQQCDVERYVMLTATQRKPAFLGLLRSLVGIGSQPVVLNQHRIVKALLQDRKDALPVVKIRNASNRVEHRVLINVVLNQYEEWMDLCEFCGSILENTCEHQFGDKRSMELVLFAEYLCLFHDLCAGRNREAVIELAGNSALGLSYSLILGALKSRDVPNEIRCRLGHLMIVMYLDRDPHQTRSPIKYEYVWSQVDEECLTSRPPNDPFSTMPALSVTPGFSDLKTQVLYHLEHAISNQVPDKGISSELDLLSVHCKIASKLCEYGFFRVGSVRDVQSPAAIKELSRLLELTYRNLNESKLLKEGLKGTLAHVRALQLQLIKLLAFGMATRTELRKQFLVTAYDTSFKNSAAPALKSVLELVVQSLKQDPLFGGLQKDLCPSAGGLTACLLTLAKADDCPDLQQIAFKLMIQNSCQGDELFKVLESLEIIASDYAGKCLNTLCECDGHIRAHGRLSLNETNGMEMVLKSLQTLVKMLDPHEHGADGQQHVADLQKLMRFRSVHTHVIHLLCFPFERIRTPGEMEHFRDPTIVPIINACYEFVREFCKSNTDNQQQMFPHVFVFAEHLNVKNLIASQALSATFENNAMLLNKLPDKLLRRFSGSIALYGKFAHFLRFLKVVTSVDGKPSKGAQDLVLKLLQEEKELILELDGNKGNGSTTNDDDQIAGILSKEGDETRFEMMMRKEYEASNSFLEYHVECFEVLTACAKGKVVANKIKCQSFMTFEAVIESILDLELLDRPAGDTRKHNADALRYIRTAIVRFFHEVYINMSDMRALMQISAEGNRMYGFGPTPDPKDRWRNQESLMDHFVREIELLTKRCKADNEAGGVHEAGLLFSRKEKVSHVQRRLPATENEFHHVYVLDAIVPCLVDYYGGSPHYAFTCRTGNTNSADCVLVAKRVAKLVLILVEVPNFLSPSDYKVCIQLLENLKACGITVQSTRDKAQKMQSVDTLLVSRSSDETQTIASTRNLFKSGWVQFYREVHGIWQKEVGINVGTRGMAILLENKADDVIGHLVHAIVRNCGPDGVVRDEEFCLDSLKALRGAMYVALSKSSTDDESINNWRRFLLNRPASPASQAILHSAGIRFLNAGALRVALLLIPQSNKEIALDAIRLANQILHACSAEAQDCAVSVIKDKGEDRVLVYLQDCLQRFADDAKHSSCKDMLRPQAASVQKHCQKERVHVGCGACELLEMLEHLCKGHERLQSILRSHNVLSVVVDFLEHVERNIMTAVMEDNTVTVLTMVKGFDFLAATIGGPNNKNRLVLTRTNVISMINRLLAKLRWKKYEYDRNMIHGYSSEDTDAVQEGFKAMLRSSAMCVLADLVQTPIEPLVAKRVIDTIDWQHLLREWPHLHSAFVRTVASLNTTIPDFLLSLGQRTSRDMMHLLDCYSSLIMDVRHASIDKAPADESKDQLIAANAVMHQGDLAAAHELLQEASLTLDHAKAPAPSDDVQLKLMRLDKAADEMLMRLDKGEAIVHRVISKEESGRVAQRKANGKEEEREENAERDNVPNGSMAFIHMLVTVVICKVEVLWMRLCGLCRDQWFLRLMILLMEQFSIPFEGALTVSKHDTQSECNRARAADMAREGLLLALTLAALEGEDTFSYHPNLKSRHELIQTCLEDIPDTASFYSSRIVSVEIVRKHVLQRLYFCMPESAMSILDKRDVLKKLDDTLYDDLPTDNEKERQEALLQRMAACASELRCSVELSAGARKWVMDYKRQLEDIPMWINVALNFVFMLVFEEHGPAAEVCLPSGYWIDFGHFGLPFFEQATWLFLFLSVLHLAFSALRFYASVVERLPYHIFQQRRQSLKEVDKFECAGEVATTVIDSALVAALKATARDGNILFNLLLVLASVFGLTWSPFFCAIPLVDLMRTSTVKTLLGSVQLNADKLGQGALVGVLLVYAHSIVGYVFFRHHHQQGKCDNLFECTMNYLIGGIKGDSIDGILQDLEIPGAIWRDPDMWARILLDISFYIIIPLVLLSIISGIIIDGFGELRDEQNEAKQYREETSVVCGVSRLTMEQFSPGSFDKHVETQQNPHHYIFLLLNLELQDETVDSVLEAFVRAQVRDMRTDFLPKGTALCLKNVEKKSPQNDANHVETLMAMLTSLHVRLRSMEKDIRWMHSQQNIALRPLDDAEKALMAAEKDLSIGFGNFPNLSIPTFSMPDLQMPEFKMQMPQMNLQMPMPNLQMPQMNLSVMSKMGLPKMPFGDRENEGDHENDCKQQ